MKLSWNEIASRALIFSRKWRDTTDEAAEAQSFLNDFFDIFGVDRKRVATFETRVPLGKNRKGYIDLLWKGVILVEMKSRGKSLDKAYAQAKEYAFNLNDEELPDYIMVGDFDNKGEQVPLIWKPLFEDYSIHFDFAYKTFIWTSEAKGRAAVHCVIIGFSQIINKRAKLIFSGDDVIEAKNINAYLLDALDIFIESRTKPLNDIPNMYAASKPVDYNHLKIEEDEYADLIKNNPLSIKYIKRMMGASEFINNKTRYCLWLVECQPDELKQMPMVLERIKKVRQARLESSKKDTQELASTPTLFAEIRQPKSNYLIIPAVSSERRKYIPIGFEKPDVIAVMGVLIIPDATLYHFGILTSSIHMAWMRVVAGRLKSDFRYSKDIVYNNFPWPTPTDKQKEMIEKAAQEVLDSRRLYPNCSLADLYDPISMPPEIVKAHSKLDKAVKKAYGYNGKRFSTEQEIVADLMERYKDLAASSH